MLWNVHRNNFHVIKNFCGNGSIQHCYLKLPETTESVLRVHTCMCIVTVSRVIGGVVYKLVHWCINYHCTSYSVTCMTYYCTIVSAVCKCLGSLLLHTCSPLSFSEEVLYSQLRLWCFLACVTFMFVCVWPVFAHFSFYMSSTRCTIHNFCEHYSSHVSSVRVNWVWCYDTWHFMLLFSSLCFLFVYFRIHWSSVSLNWRSISS